MGAGGWIAKHNHLIRAPGNAGLCLLSLDDGQVGVGPMGSSLPAAAPAPRHRNGPLGLQ